MNEPIDRFIEESLTKIKPLIESEIERRAQSLMESELERKAESKERVEDYYAAQEIAKKETAEFLAEFHVPGSRPAHNAVFKHPHSDWALVHIARALGLGDDAPRRLVANHAVSIIKGAFNLTVRTGIRGKTAAFAFEELIRLVSDRWPTDWSKVPRHFEPVTGVNEDGKWATKVPAGWSGQTGTAMVEVSISDLDTLLKLGNCMYQDGWDDYARAANQLKKAIVEKEQVGGETEREASIRETVAQAKSMHDLTINSAVTPS